MSELAGPDIEGALRAYLRNDAGVVATAAGTRTFLATTSSVAFPYILVTRIGGGEDTSTAPMDRALIQIDVYGRVRQLSEANAVRRAVRAALKALELSPYIATGSARLLGAIVRDDRRFPEPESQDPDGAIGERPRFILTVEVVGVAA